jgi:hypothetical protein
MKFLDSMILATPQASAAVRLARIFADFPAALPGIRVPYPNPQKA